MADADQLILALASLRDSLARISTRADNEDNALLGTALRLKCNQLRKAVVLREFGGDLPPVPEVLVSRIFQASGAVSAVDPDADESVAAALEVAGATLGAVSDFLLLRTS